MPVCMTSGVLRLTTPFSPKPALSVPSDALIGVKAARESAEDDATARTPPPPGQ